MIKDNDSSMVKHLTKATGHADVKGKTVSVEKAGAGRENV